MEKCKILLDHPSIKGAANLFQNPKYIIECKNPIELKNKLNEIEQICKIKQLYAVGFIAYEAGLCFEEKLIKLIPNNFKLPLLKFGLFDSYKFLNKSALNKYYYDSIHGEFCLQNFKILENKKNYYKKIKKIKKYINNGDVYQVNYTFQVEIDFLGDLINLYLALKKNQSTQLGALLEFNDFSILSFSPELFFNLKDNILSCKPMKGTIQRGKNDKEDKKLKKYLYNDTKNRAENLMIVDLLRNDLSIISKINSVKVSNLYNIETYKSLFQMTTKIFSKKKSNINFLTMIKALFPCGSITGVPKIRAMQIINELEDRNREIYCGSIGFIAPNGDMNFNVAIRTITTLKTNPNKLYLGIGSGIIHDSNAVDEYKESLLKMKFIKNINNDFQLIESLYFYNKYFLLSEHIDRLCKSSIKFHFKFIRKKIIDNLFNYSKKLNCYKQYKINLLLFKSGNIKINHIEIKKNTKIIYNLLLSKITIEKNNIFIHHKTTKRCILDQELARIKIKYPSHKINEIIFCNKQGYITEGSYTNIFIKQNGIFYTPSLDVGVLDGVLRSYLLKKYPNKFKIKNFKFIQLNLNNKIMVGNSVRGLIKARLLKLN